MLVRLVVADTGPLNYLVLIDAVDLLPRLFAQVLVPVAVYDELSHANAPERVRAFAANRPEWLEVRPNPDVIDPGDTSLDEGERAAIALAMSVGADLVLVDDRIGVKAARRCGLVATGTLGVLDFAALRGLVDLQSAFMRLKATNFHYPPGVIDVMLARHRNPKA